MNLNIFAELKVFAVYAGYPYESGKILGVFSSEEKAKAAIEEERPRHGYSWYADVHPFWLDNEGEERDYY